MIWKRKIFPWMTLFFYDRLICWYNLKWCGMLTSSTTSDLESCLLIWITSKRISSFMIWNNITRMNLYYSREVPIVSSDCVFPKWRPKARLLIDMPPLMVFIQVHQRLCQRFSKLDYNSPTSIRMWIILLWRVTNSNTLGIFQRGMKYHWKNPSGCNLLYMWHRLYGTFPFLHG